MAWTPPATIATTLSQGHLVTPADMALILDDLQWLKVRPYTAANMTGTPSTASTSFVLVTGLTVDITSTGGNVEISAILTSSNSVTSAHVFTAYINGVNQGDATFGLITKTNTQANAVENESFTFITSTPPAAGTVTCAIYWRVTGNTGTMFTGRIQAREIG